MTTNYIRVYGHGVDELVFFDDRNEHATEAAIAKAQRIRAAHTALTFAASGVAPTISIYRKTSASIRAGLQRIG